LVHTYTRFRIKLTLRALGQLLARLRSSGEIVLLALGPATLGLLACAALPTIYAASLPLLPALALLVLHGMAMSLPIALLRPRILPGHVLHWLHPLPVPPRLQLAASLAVSGLLALPLALAYALSLAIWLGQHQRPEWIMPGRALGGTALSFLLSWACGAWLLYRTALPPLPTRLPAAQAEAIAWTAPPRPGWPRLGHLLFWLPMWRGSRAGLRLALLLAGALAAMLLWMFAPMIGLGSLPRPAGAVLASVLLVLLVHEADDGLRTQLARLVGALAGLPLDLDALGGRARGTLLAFLAVPLAFLTGAGLAAQAWTHTAGRAWLALAWSVPLLLVLTPPFTPRGRMALVAFYMVTLCATGSKVWN
jgi:hypothetical protein